MRFTFVHRRVTQRPLRDLMMMNFPARHLAPRKLARKVEFNLKEAKTAAARQRVACSYVAEVNGEISSVDARIQVRARARVSV